MKLTEQQIIKMFRQQSAGEKNLVDATEAMDHAAASDARLDVAEQVASDFTSAQIFQQTYQMKAWSEAISSGVESASSVQSDVLASIRDFFKPVLFATAMASAVWLVLPTNQSSMPTPLHVPITEMQTVDRISDGFFDQGDVIGSGSFDQSDVIGSGSFEDDKKGTQSDRLFSGSFS